MKLTKTKIDEKRLADDLWKDRIMVYLANADKLKFNVGDILIKQTNYGDDEQPEWTTETDGAGCTVQYVYAFENELGVGYVKRLKNDGSGPCKKQPEAITKFDPRVNKFILDPDYADHLILGEGEFDYSAKSKRQIEFRKEALEKNEKLCLKFKKPSDAKTWWQSLKIGDIIYVGTDLESLGDDVLEVIKIKKNKITMRVIATEWDEVGEEYDYSRTAFIEHHDFISMEKPYPLSEDKV